ncbi:MAG: hypothetical protein MH825_01670 [Cyanobacteria bacterium]|nr:hypothetical protein [Cyanobacteriota bacterium]
MPEPLNSKDVVSVEQPYVGHSIPSKTFLFGEMYDNMTRHFHARQRLILSQGLPCQVLKEAGGGWQSGHLKIEIVFVPDQSQSVDPPSPLDDIREISS